MMRVVLRVVLAMEEKPEQVWLAGDSETVLACREKESGCFGEFFRNSLGELWDTQEKLEEHTKVGENGEWWHVPTEHNPADRTSRLDSKPEDIGLESAWQNGPQFLYQDRSSWLLERNFAEQKAKVKIPKEDILKKFRLVEDSDIFACRLAARQTPEEKLVAGEAEAGTEQKAPEVQQAADRKLKSTGKEFSEDICWCSETESRGGRSRAWKPGQ